MDSKKVVRRMRALERLKVQLVKGTKPDSYVSLHSKRKVTLKNVVVPLSDKDKARIEREIKALSTY